jgi:hypothetical protein
MRFLALFLVIAATAPVARAVPALPLKIENQFLSVSCDDGGRSFSVADKASGVAFLTDGKLDGNSSGARVETASDPIFGAGKRIVVSLSGGGEDSLELYGGLPFVLVRGTRVNPGAEALDISNVTVAIFSIDLRADLSTVKTMGTGGLLPADQNPGSYLFLTCADSKSRNGVVAGWLTEDRGSGVVFSDIKDGKVQFRARADYGRLRIPAGKSAQLETLAIGYFGDARVGEELYAEAIKKQYAIHLPEPSAVYCTWYSDKHHDAGDEKSTVELARFAEENLKPFGFGCVQVDDEWQDGPHLNGPRRGFDRVRPDGPYAHGIAPVAEEVQKAGLQFGLWWLPFGRNFQDPAYKDRQDWFVKGLDGKPYDTAWGGTCLDLTNPDVQAHLASISKIIRSWGVTYYKMDGLWTGEACAQIYINDGYKEDHFGNTQPFHDPLVSNVEAYRNGLRLIRQNAGPGVFFSGCCVAQNMRELAAIGLVDSMRIGPDYDADHQGARTGPLRGSRLYFLNGRVWWNDPDPCIVRAKGGRAATLALARMSASWVSLTGQFFLNSDWFPDLPPERLNILKRTMSHHHAVARPVDYFENELATTWLITDTNQNVERDVIGLFNYGNTPLEVDDSAAMIGLRSGKTYEAFDFWDNVPLPSFRERFGASVPPHSCRVIAVRADEDHPMLLSTSRHVTQGMIDVRDERWKEGSLSAVSTVVGNDPYELRIVAPSSSRAKWKFVSASLSAEDTAAGATISQKEDSQLIRLVIRSAASRSVNWTAHFERLQ